MMNKGNLLQGKKREEREQGLGTRERTDAKREMKGWVPLPTNGKAILLMN